MSQDVKVSGSVDAGIGCGWLIVMIIIVQILVGIASELGGIRKAIERAAFSTEHK